MKKIIAMLLVLAVFVGGVFAVYGDSTAGGIVGGVISGTGTPVDKNNAATLNMTYTPYTGTAYFLIGFDTKNTVTKEEGHLNLNGLSEEVGTLMLTSDTSNNQVSGSGKFRIFYEIVTAESLSLDLSFSGKLTATADGDSTTISYSLYEGTSASGTAVSGSSKSIIDSTSDGMNIGIKEFFVKTEDASAKKAQGYKETVTLTLKAN